MSYHPLDYYDAARNDELGPSFLPWCGVQIGIATIPEGGVYVWAVENTAVETILNADELDAHEFLDALDEFAAAIEGSA